MVEALKSAFRFLAAPSWNNYVVAPFGGLANATTDAELEAYVRANAATVYHPVSTARMSPVNASWGVVDPSLLLKGAVGIRVVDASVFVSFLISFNHFIVPFLNDVFFFF